MKKSFENAPIEIYVNSTVGTVANEWITSPASREVREMAGKIVAPRQNQFARWILTWNWGVKQN